MLIIQCSIVILIFIDVVDMASIVFLSKKGFVSMIPTNNLTEQNFKNLQPNNLSQNTTVTTQPNFAEKMITSSNKYGTEDEALTSNLSKINVIAESSKTTKQTVNTEISGPMRKSLCALNEKLGSLRYIAKIFS